MFGSQLSCGANRVCPIEFDMRPISNPYFLLQQPGDLSGFSLLQQARTLGLAEAVKHLDPLPMRPEHLCLRVFLKKTQCRLMLDITAAFIPQPPGSVGVKPHFLSEARKAVPSNLRAFALPIDRFSA